MTEWEEEKAQHKKFAKDLFNYTWDLMDRPQRTEEEDETMIHAAHASRFHWGIVGTPLNFARGEWQISRAYSLVKRAEPALFHARKSLAFCSENNIGGFDLGFAYEALARAFAVLGDSKQRDENLELARQCAARVEDENDKKWLLANVESVTTLTVPVWEEA